MRKNLTVILMATLLGACVVLDVPEETQPDRQFRLNDDYLAIYARSNWQMRGCRNQAPHQAPGFGTEFLPAEYDEVPGASHRNNLYRDQNYAVVIEMIPDPVAGIRPFSQIRVDKDGTGTIVRLYDLSTLGVMKDRKLDWLEYWARGGKNCQGILNPSSPPPL